MKSIIFYLGLGTFFTHELDAITNHEWRVFPLTNWLADENGLLVFLYLHIPLFAVLIGLVASANEKLRYRSRLGISTFLIAHGLLHCLFIGSANYEFATASSNILIFGGAAFGAVHLILEYLGKSKINA